MMFPPGLPKLIYVLLAPIEFLSNFIIRPFTHAVRLFANMFAGHLHPCVLQHGRLLVPLRASSRRSASPLGVVGWS